ncbi:unnamed protein product [Urochloa humidicola]
MANQWSLPPPFDMDGEGEHLYLLGPSRSSRLRRRGSSGEVGRLTLDRRRPDHHRVPPKRSVATGICIIRELVPGYARWAWRMPKPSGEF